FFAAVRDRAFRPRRAQECLLHEIAGFFHSRRQPARQPEETLVMSIEHHPDTFCRVRPGGGRRNRGGHRVREHTDINERAIETVGGLPSERYRQSTLAVARADAERASAPRQPTALPPSARRACQS